MHGKIEAEAPDAVILDINMPGENGLTALRLLRADGDSPVIMLTAMADVIDRVLGLEMGADDYLGKPVDLRGLEARLKAVLRRRPKRVLLLWVLRARAPLPSVNAASIWKLQR